MRILLVDDEANVRDVIRYFGQWEQLGIEEISEAANGEEAKALIALEQPEILITDIKMPKMNGIQLLEWLSEIEYSCKVIILTGYDDYVYMRKAINFGAYDYLMKPVNPEELNVILEGAVQTWNNEREARRDKQSGIHDEVRRERWSRNVNAACDGRPYDRDILTESIPYAENYEFTLIYFYQSHMPESYIKRLSEELIELDFGNVFSLQTERHLYVMISAAGKLQAIERWIAKLVDIPVRLTGAFPVRSLEELAFAYEEAKQAMQANQFRMIHQLSPQDDSRRIQDIVTFVNSHFTEEISLDLLARRFFFSREHISRRFKQEAGMTLSDYLNQLRVEQAKKWLRETEDKMFAISVKLGYQDEKYFSKLFKRMVGMTPMEYRDGKAGGTS
ncbi:response regulator [Paenibacillus abyssi]|uniref:DNA-binding response regulator n=1 Tax=Paenibacillus abyssi TaxID=1340531 RepID=A0A917G478_9BACL|nr:response regulator [Paenibacillus abyssi]GGG22408.1 hypothetical protein GCM10010916_43810 [Paenibacillus abyssi]